jgi:hypothetical protein
MSGQQRKEPHMTIQRDMNLKRVKQELGFIRRLAQNQIEGNFDEVDEISMSVQSALEALDELELSLQPAGGEEIAAHHVAASVQRITIFEPVNAARQRG